MPQLTFCEGKLRQERTQVRQHLSILKVYAASCQLLKISITFQARDPRNKQSFCVIHQIRLAMAADTAVTPPPKLAHTELIDRF